MFMKGVSPEDAIDVYNQAEDGIYMTTLLQVFFTFSTMPSMYLCATSICTSANCKKVGRFGYG